MSNGWKIALGVGGGIVAIGVIGGLAGSPDDSESVAADPEPTASTEPSVEPEPEPSVEPEPEPETNYSEQVLSISMETTWNRLSAAERDSVCTAYISFPNDSYESLVDGWNSGDSSDIGPPSWEMYTEFFDEKCAL